MEVGRVLVQCSCAAPAGSHSGGGGGGKAALSCLWGQTETFACAEASMIHSLNSGRLVSSQPCTLCQKFSCDQACFVMKL